MFFHFAYFKDGKVVLTPSRWSGRVQKLYKGEITLAKSIKSLFSSVKTILTLKPDLQTQQMLLKKGIPKRQINNGTAIIDSLVKKATDGEISAIKEVISLASQDNSTEKEDLSILYEVLEKDED